MPPQIGYVGGEPYQPVHYPRARKPRGFARNLGAGRPAKAGSNQIRKVIKRRAMHAGVGPQPQVSPAGSGVISRSHYDRGQPPQTSMNVTINVPSNQRGQGGRAYGAFAGRPSRASSNDAVRQRRPRGVRRGPLKGFTQG